MEPYAGARFDEVEIAVTIRIEQRDGAPSRTAGSRAAARKRERVDERDLRRPRGHEIRFVESDSTKAGREYWRKKSLPPTDSLKLAFELQPQGGAAFDPRRLRAESQEYPAYLREKKREPTSGLEPLT